ncbi:MAG TPA: adenylate/guanylate cyclase domain-containing protein, partial [Acidimicrobiales bacterium]|nr:adenylate/guanylate cyclase domain-containing protein [Acidimicrobiales bacterium]
MTQTTAIPTGTVTLLFTDVEGSTRLWETEPDAMGTALRRHDELLRDAIGQAGGYVFKTVGDAFCAAFSTPKAALDSVLASQRALVTEHWPTTRPIKVRMALHTGVCEERDGDYFGPVVNRTARLEAVAHGGQVLLSGATAELLAPPYPAGVKLKDMGVHRLKDLGRAEQVFQIEADLLPSEFPPLRSLDNPELSNNLPILLSPFVGRRRELQEVGELIGTSRLVTLTGAGGSGKTRLSLHAAADVLDRGRGVFLVELAAVADPELLPLAVSTAIGLKDSATAQSVAEALGDQEVLLVLDNCEHVIDASARFAGVVLQRCPRVGILATSREPLGVDGERVYRVPSLSLPPADSDSVDELADSDAVHLFVERAQVQDPAFVLDQSHAAIVASVCRRLDGIPLALELAAARLSSMSLANLHERLDQRFRLLTGGSRNALPRQQTLQAMVDWSFDLLEAREQEVLRRLSVFVGGFELEGAEAVCAVGDIDVFDVTDILGSLVDKSLVQADRSGSDVRYRLLETIRQYCAQDLLKSGGEPAVIQARDRHANYYLELAETSGGDESSPKEIDWLKRFDVEWDNFKSSFAHFASSPGGTEAVLRLSTALARFQVSRGHSAVLPYTLEAVDRAEDKSSLLYGWALLSAAMLEENVLGQTGEGHRAHAGGLPPQSLAIAREKGDRKLEIRSLALMSGFAKMARDEATAKMCAEQTVTLARQENSPQLLGEALAALALVAETEDERRTLRLEQLACFRQSGDTIFTAGALYSLFGVEFGEGRLAEARTYAEEAIEMAVRAGSEALVFLFRSDFATLLVAQGDIETALSVIRSGLLATKRLGLHMEMCSFVFAAACCSTAAGEFARAARLHGAARLLVDKAIANG